MIKNVSPEHAVYRSLGLSAMCESLQGTVACKILELGTVSGDNVAFWSQYSPSIYIADLRSRLPLPPMPEDPESLELPEPDWEHVLELPADLRFDIILAWDLLNYLELPLAASLIRYLCRFCLPGTLLFALIFDQKQMPKQITVYRILDQGKLRYECENPEQRPCPRHQPRDITGIMHRFRAANSFRLQNGIVEYLFSFES